MATTRRSVQLLAVLLGIMVAMAFMPLLSDAFQAHAASKLKVKPTSVKLEVGGNATVTASGLKAKELKKVTWKSSNTSIVNITKAKGKSIKVQGIKVGSAKVTAKYGKKSATVKVTVKEPAPPVFPVEGVTLNKDSLTLVPVETETLFVAFEPRRATDKAVTWKSSDEAIAKVDENGKVTAVAAGVAKITVTTHDGEKTADCAVTVTTPENKTVNPDGYVKQGDTSVTGYYQGDATVYSLLYQESAEVAAMQMQAFSLAKERLDAAMGKNNNKGEGLAIVTDIDSTIADDTCYIAGAVLDAAGRIGLGLEPWNNDDWDGYYHAVATDADTVIPGAKQFVDYAYSKGVQFYYITNRPYYELDLTVQQLNKMGFFEQDPTVQQGKGIVEAYKPVKDWQAYYYYEDPQLSKDSECLPDGPYSEAINATGTLEMATGSFSVKDDYRVQVQGTWFDSDKSDRRANVAKTVGKDNIVMYMGDSINDMVSDAEKDVWGVHTKDFTRKQFNQSRTANASNEFWAGSWGKDELITDANYDPGHWGNDFIVLPNATYGDWYKATWAKGSQDGSTGINSKTVEGQQEYIYGQIWHHSYKNDTMFKTWYDGPSPIGDEIQ